MENSRAHEMMVMVVSVVITGWLALVAMGDPTLHKVGGSKGWNQNVNYTEWSAQEHVYVGDWLLFVFDKRHFNVLEVNKTSYENCIDRDFIKNVTRGGRDVVQLTEARAYYYITGGGYCYHGMRVAVQAEELQDQAGDDAATAPVPVPSEISGSLLPSLNTCSVIILANMFFMNLVSMGIL